MRARARRGPRLFPSFFTLSWVLLPSLLLAQNQPPATPTITEPGTAGQILNAADVHMETAPFSDPDPGDTHLCTDWEIRLVVGNELVWRALCVMGLESVHAHFGDGLFVGSHAGRTELFPETDYRLRVRHRDDSGFAVSEWSDFAERNFLTGPATQLFPLELDDVLTAPTPSWVSGTALPIVLPVAVDPPRLVLEQADGSLLLELRALDQVQNEIVDGAPLPDHAPARLRLSSGGLAGLLSLPESDLSFVDHQGDAHTVYLPPLAASAGQDALLWIAANGATYLADPTDAAPDFSDLARGVPVPWVVDEPGYKVEIVASGFRLPVNVAFVPVPGGAPGDVLYYVSELYGTIRSVTNDGAVTEYAGSLLNYSRSGAFPGSGEQGVTGLVVDPTNGDVIAAMLYDAGGQHYPKVVRFTSTDGGITASSVTTLLDMPGESQGQSHQISNLTFGPDGKLYVHNGDGFSTGTALNLESFRGKILRLEPDGSPVPDNPFYDAGNGITARDHIFAYGVRNPFGGAWRAADGLHYEVENGPSVDRFAQVVSGRNFGWTGSDASMSTFALYNWAPATGPTNIAFVQPSTHGGSGFPLGIQGHAFVAESGSTWATGPQGNGKRIRRYVLDSAGNLTAGPLPFVRYVGTGKATVVALAAGPDGLYFSDFYKDLGFTGPTDPGANILRVRYVGFADFTADVTDGAAPLLVSFQDASDVPGATSWEWDFGDGSTGSGIATTHLYAQDGIYDVQLAVTGPSGVQVAAKAGFIQVGDFPRVALIGGNFPLTASDAAVASFLAQQGFDVTAYDDEPANRPSAQTLAVNHDVVIVSSTVLSGNIGGEFRTAAVPLIFWEHALLTLDREPLATGGAVVAGQTTVMVIDDQHPVTQGLPLGNLVVSSPAAMTVAFAPYGAGAQVLATRAGAPGDATLVVAEAGAALLGGYAPPARRVFLAYEDTSFTAATPEGRDLLRRSVDWARGADPNAFRRGDCNGDGNRDITDPVFLLLYLFAQGPTPSCLDACDAEDDGALAIGDAIYLLQYLFSSGPTLPPPFPACGSDQTADALDCGGGGC